MTDTAKLPLMLGTLRLPTIGRTDKDVRNALRSNRRIRLHQPRPKNRTRSS